MNEIWIETAQGNIFGMMAGDDEAPVVLGLHGRSPRNGWHTWEPFIVPLAEAGYRPVCVDMPGWGQSPAWDDFNPPAAVLAILDSLGAETAVLLGKSWGGGVALNVALQRPAHVRQLILTAPAFGGDMAALTRLTQPVLMAWAKDDAIIPYTHAARLAGAMPHCQLETYAQGGHSAAQHNATDFIPKAIQFLK